MLAAILVCALLPSWLGLLGGWLWVLDVLAHFRWQYLIVSAAVLAIALWRRQRTIAALALATLLLNGVLIGRLAWPPEVGRADVGPGAPLQVVTLNLLGSNPNTQAVLDYLQHSNADVIVVEEATYRWVAALAPLRVQYPYGLARPRLDYFGIALFSRVPLADAQILGADAAVMPSIEARLDWQGHDLVVIGTHPPPPEGPDWAHIQQRQMQLLAARVRQLGEPVLLLGDLNATPWSARLRILTAAGLGFRSLSPPWVPTWSVRSIFAIPIDHVLATAPLAIVQRAVGPDVGSDHRPLQVSVAWNR